MKRLVVLVMILGGVAIAVLALVGTLVLAREEAKPQFSTGCGNEPPAVPGKTEVLSLEVGGLERGYRLHLPPDYDQNTASSLVLAFHTWASNAHNRVPYLDEPPRGQARLCRRVPAGNLVQGPDRGDGYFVE